MRFAHKQLQTTVIATLSVKQVMKIIIFSFLCLISFRCFANCELDELQLKIYPDGLEKIIGGAIKHAKYRHNVEVGDLGVEECDISKSYLRLEFSPHAKIANTEYFLTIFCYRTEEDVSCSSYVGRIREFKGNKIELGSYVQEKDVEKIYQCVEGLKSEGKLYKFEWDHCAKKLVGSMVEKNNKILNIYSRSDLHAYVVHYADSRFSVQFSLEGECSVTWLPEIVV